ncbi:MAG: hypothetical protein H7326_07695 [Bdellovibrionaceae bacterium]|nr:hypothetical protein [Pseudobdellovibrionaceae bacterium]
MKLALLVTGAVMVGSFAFAADQEASGSTKVDTSKNIITGTKTTKKKTKQKMKDAHGNESDATVTETTKVHKDGTVDKNVEVDAESKDKK